MEPRLPVTLGSGGTILPNSDAEFAEFAKESAKYNEAVNTRSRSGSLKRSHRDLNTGNGKNNSDNHVNGGCARSQGLGQGAPQLPRPNEVAQTTPISVTTTTPNSVAQTTQNAQQTLEKESQRDFNSFNHSAQLDTIKDLAQTTPNSVPQTMSNSVPQTMHPDCTPIAVLETTNSAPEANTLAPEPNTLAQEPNTLAPQAVTFIGVEFLIHINTSNNSDQLSMIRNDDNLDEAMGDVDP
jgi:hypothetical protein